MTSRERRLERRKRRERRVKSYNERERLDGIDQNDEAGKWLAAQEKLELERDEKRRQEP